MREMVVYSERKNIHLESFFSIWLFDNLFRWKKNIRKRVMWGFWLFGEQPF